MQIQEDTPHQQAARIVICISSSISFISTTYLISKLIYNKGFQQIEKLMILLLLFGDFLQSISMLFPVAIFGNSPPDNYYDLCQAQAFIQQFGILFQFFWALNIALAANMGYKQETSQQIRDRTIFTFLLGFLGPIILTVIPLASNDYSKSEILQASICFIAFGNISIIMTFVLPIIIIFILNFILFFEIIIIIYRQIGNKIVWSIVFRLMTYPMILFMTQFWVELIYHLSSLFLLYKALWITAHYGMFTGFGVISSVIWLGSLMFQHMEQMLLKIKMMINQVIRTIINIDELSSYSKESINISLEPSDNLRRQ
ncbi:hypothetical protein pb186bvf_008838 [Paramecium bursaria]